MGREGTTFELEAPRPLTLVGIAVVCSVAGFALARASLDVDRAALAERADEARDSARTEDADEPTNEVADAPTTDAPATGPVDAGAPAVVAAVDAGVAATSGVAEVVEGRVAYLRCEGLPNVPPAGPCPRDHGAEAKVWDAIRALPSCPALANLSGHSDVRVVFDGARVSGLGFRDLPEELDREAVRGCLEPALDRVRTSLGTTRLTASFRFELIR